MIWINFESCEGYIENLLLVVQKLKINTETKSLKQAYNKNV